MSLMCYQSADNDHWCKPGVCRRFGGTHMCNQVIVGLLLALLSCLAAAATPQCSQEILAQSKQAHGGDAWDVIHTTYSTGKLTTSGLTGQAESWEDNLTGRYVEKYQLDPTSGADGFDGKLVWSQDSSGQARAE